MGNYPSRYDKTCVTCRNYRWKKSGYEIWIDSDLRFGFNCSVRSGRYRLDDSCSYYEENPYISERDIDDIKSFLDKYTSYRFYVLSTLCEILNISFDSSFMQAFRLLRDVSFQYPNGLEHLGFYDYYGVQISDALINEYENDNSKMAFISYLQQSIINKYIIPFTKMVLEYHNYPAAIKIYGNMIIELANRYKIVIDINNIPFEKTSELGFARKKTLKDGVI